jgi:two-component system NtrC family sensor kinase
MAQNLKTENYDFKGLGFSKSGHFKQVRAKIKELENISNEREAIINNMTDGLTILDRDLNIVFANKIQQDMFQNNALLGEKCYSAFFQKSSSCTDCPALKTFANEKTLSGETVVNHKVLGKRYIDWSTSYIKDPSGCAPKIILLMRDVTKRKESEFELMRADKLAAMGLLVAGIAHEINNPLTSIAGFSESLLKRVKTRAQYPENSCMQDLQDYLEIINQEAYRCSNIIHNLIRYTRESTDSFTTVDISQIIRDTILLVRPYAKDNGIQINSISPQEGETKNIVGNDSHLKHLFLNLFNYALDAMVDGGRLAVELQVNANELEVLITNIGSELLPDGAIGETSSDSNQLFNISQLGSGGTPLSLSVCSNIVQYHRGQLSMRHNHGGEFVISIRLPTSKD